MRSHTQIEASRRHGARSRGPVTAEGNARSSQDARTRGLFSHNLLLPQGKAKRDVLELQRRFSARLQPATPEESDLVYRMALALWQKRRCLRLETDLLDSPDAVNTHCRELSYLLRQQDHLHRTFERHLRTLLRNKNYQTNPSPAVE